MNLAFQNLISSFRSHQIDAFLVTKDVNIRYLTGFPASDSWLLVTRKKIFYITDFRYILEAKKFLKEIVVHRYVHSVFQSIADLTGQGGVKTLGVDEQHVSLAFFNRLKKALSPKIRIKLTSGLVEKLREIKTVAELKVMRQAIKLNLEIYHRVQGFLKVGMTEKEILNRLERFIQVKGVGFSFAPIIASGPNACFPHAKVSDRKLKNNESVLIDVGVDINGYKSDLTRIFFLGRIPPLLINICNIVKEAQQRAIAKIRAGARACDVDAQARNYLDNQKLGKFFGHSLGHGVGLEIHEAPRLSSQSKAVLEAGHVVTVEPAVYIPGRFGIRVEDMVLVKEDGCEILSRDPAGGGVPTIF